MKTDEQEAITWWVKVFKLDARRLMKEKIVKKKDIIECYQRAKENGLA